jgi:hypothetical protein
LTGGCFSPALVLSRPARASCPRTLTGSRQQKNLIAAKKAEIARLNQEARAAGEQVPSPGGKGMVDEEDEDGNVVI